MKEANNNTVSLFRMSTVVYGAMAVVGLALNYFFHDSLTSLLSKPVEPKESLRLIGMGIVAAAFLLILSYNFENWFPSFRDLKTVIMRLLGPCSTAMAVYLALISSIGEELLFRGALQPFIGIWFTSLIFGLVHLSPDGKVSAWSLWAFIAGLILGWTVEDTGSLWPAITAHFVVNCISLLHLRYSYKKWTEAKT